MLQGSWADWDSLRLSELQFSQATTARLVVVAMIGVALAVFVLRMIVRASAHRGRMALPALMAFTSPGRGSIVRHGALLLALAGLPFFILALADPRTVADALGNHVSGPPHQPADRRLVQHAVGAAVDHARQGRAEQRRLLHDGGRGPLLHRAPHERASTAT